jgi:hypothetical protein
MGVAATPMGEGGGLRATPAYVVAAHYKNSCILPLTVCHVYGHSTRGKLFATCATHVRSECD